MDRCFQWHGSKGRKEQLSVRVVGREERGDLLTPARLQEALALTPREAEVLFWIDAERRGRKIAAVLTCMPATVAKHAERIFAKLGVETRAAAAAMARAA